jgi:hypothetical protein
MLVKIFIQVLEYALEIQKYAKKNVLTLIIKVLIAI